MEAARSAADSQLAATLDRLSSQISLAESEKWKSDVLIGLKITEFSFQIQAAYEAKRKIGANATAQALSPSKSARRVVPRVPKQPAASQAQEVVTLIDVNKERDRLELIYRVQSILKTGKTASEYHE